MTKLETLPRQLDSQQRRMVAAVAAVGEATVKRYLRGEPLSPNSRARIRRAIAALVECGELDVEASPTPQTEPPSGRAALLRLVPDPEGECHVVDAANAERDGRDSDDLERRAQCLPDRTDPSHTCPSSGAACGTGADCCGCAEPAEED